MAIRLLIGAALLTLGRKLFWLFVGGIGFMAGITLASRFMGAQSEQMVLLFGIVGGLLGAALAVMLQKMAVAVSGFVAGGYLLVTGLDLIGINTGQWDWVLFLVGGFIGVILMAKLFEWALILLSSLSGAIMIAQALPVEGQVVLLITLTAFVMGLVIQTGILRGRKIGKRVTPDYYYDE